MKKSLFMLSLFASLVLVGCGSSSSDGDNSSSQNNTTDDNGKTDNGKTDGKTKSLTINKVEDIYGYKVTGYMEATTGDIKVESDITTTFYCDGSSTTVQKGVVTGNGQKITESSSCQSDEVRLSGSNGKYTLIWGYKECSGSGDVEDKTGGFDNIGLNEDKKVVVGGIYGGIDGALKNIEKVENCK